MSVEICAPNLCVSLHRLNAAFRFYPLQDLKTMIVNNKIVAAVRIHENLCALIFITHPADIGLRPPHWLVVLALRTCAPRWFFFINFIVIKFYKSKSDLSARRCARL